MGFEHRFRQPNFAWQSGSGARTIVGPMLNVLNIIHINLMLLKKYKCVKKNCLTSIQPRFGQLVLKKKCKILLSKKVYM